MSRVKVFAWVVSLTLGLSLVPAPLSAAPACMWADGTGTVVAEKLTPEEAKQLALRKARAMAIEKAVGIEVNSETVTKDFMLAVDFIKTLVRGYIKREQIVGWEQEKYQPVPSDAPIPIYRVQMRVCVLPRPILRDPEFVLRAELNKAIYTPGDKGRLQVTSSRRAQVAIFNLTADDRVRPYMGQPGIGPPLFLEPEEGQIFPPRGVSLVMQLPPGQTRTAEAFIIVATKTDDGVSLPLRMGTRDSLSLTEFYENLIDIEADMVETIVPYSIMEK
jgi:hypothetical protein